MTPPKSSLRKSTDMPKTIHRVKFKKAIARHTKIRDQNPSLGYICPGEPTPHITRVSTNNIVMWEILLSNADWDCFRTLTLREILKIQNLLQGEHYVYLVVIHLYQKVGCVRKQTSVSHSSTESEIISLDTGLRLDGLLALELWDLIVSVFGNISHISDRTGATCEWEEQIS